MNDYTDSFSPEDIERNKYLSLLSYLGFLFIIPLFARRNSAYAKFHANQGLVLFLTMAIVGIIHRLLKFIFGFFPFVLIPLNYLFSVLGILILVFIVIGVMNTVGGRAKELPVIGRIHLIR